MASDARLSAAGARSELLALLRHKGILYAEPDRPLIDRRGNPASWMLYSWNLSLTAEGARLMAVCLLDRLKSFESTQLASFGYTAMPLLAACIALGNGRYTGLCIRETPKGYGAVRQIDGPADPRRPVVIVDDSLSSGTSLLKGIAVLERHGFHVEGAVCLVHFPHRGGQERAVALGYRIETLFDIWDDLQMPVPIYTPGWQRVGPIHWAEQRLEDGLHPAAAARQTARHYLATGRVLQPPRSLLERYEAAGGTYVSFRDRGTDYRLARDGFWHFDPADSDPCRDLVLATVKTVASGKLQLEQLDRLKIGVTFFGPLEQIAPSGLDFARYGIVVRSRAWPIKVGGALPNTQVFISEQEQYALARRNARLGPFEPHDLFRHSVAKYVEPGAAWLPYGAPSGPEGEWAYNEAIGRALTERAHAVLRAVSRGEPVPSGALDGTLIPASISGVAVTLYRHGVVGCSVSGGASLDACLVRAVQGACRDGRFAQRRAQGTWDEVVPAVSVLYNREWLGAVTAEYAARKLRLGLDAISVHQKVVDANDATKPDQDAGSVSGKEKAALFLAAVAPHFNWDKQKITRELLAKAKIDGGPATWVTYQTTTWLYGEHRPVRQVFGFAGPGTDCAGDGWLPEIELLGGYIAANIEPTGLPLYGLSPIDGRRWPSGTATRIVHALTALHTAGEIAGRAEWAELARRGLDRCLEHFQIDPDGRSATLALPDQRCGPFADSQLLYALCACGGHAHSTDAADLLARSVLRLFQPDGSITADASGVRQTTDHDFLPGAALLSIVEYARKRPGRVDVRRLEPCVDWYLRRFRNVHPWGIVGWHTQAWSALHRMTRSAAQAAAVFELADWAIDRQVAANGAFITDLNPNGPSFHTAFIAEGIAAAWALALEVGDEARARRYRHSWQAAMRFVLRLVIRPEDAPYLPDPARGVGGVRGTLTTSMVRIDFVSHTLMALCKGVACLSSSAP